MCSHAARGVGCDPVWDGDDFIGVHGTTARSKGSFTPDQIAVCSLMMTNSVTSLARRVGVCSWSLRPTDPADLAAQVRGCGLTAVQLALDPIRRGEWPLEETRTALSNAGIRILSGMMGTVGEDYSTLETIRATGGLRPMEHWDANLAAAGQSADIARTLGLSLVTFHAGFLPHDRGDRERGVLLDRLGRVADVFASRGIALALETGQETAETLVDVLRDLDRPNVGVNFDPANMILYGMGDPARSLRTLLPSVRQMHVKDANATEVAGEWGTEVPVGRGQVRWRELFEVVDAAARPFDLVIEREAGERRAEDVRAAVAVVGSFVRM